VGHGVDNLDSRCQLFFQALYAGSAHHIKSQSAATLANQLARRGKQQQASPRTDDRAVSDQEKVPSHATSRRLVSR
jgi:hypothetical protein